MKVKKGVSKGRRIFNATTESKPYKELFKEQYKFSKVQGRAEAILKTYIHHYKYFLEFMDESVQCHEITRNRVEDYVVYL